MRGGQRRRQRHRHACPQPAQHASAAHRCPRRNDRRRDGVGGGVQHGSPVWHAPAPPPDPRGRRPASSERCARDDRREPHARAARAPTTCNSRRSSAGAGPASPTRSGRSAHQGCPCTHHVQVAAIISGARPRPPAEIGADRAPRATRGDRGRGEDRREPRIRVVRGAHQGLRCVNPARRGAGLHRRSGRPVTIGEPPPARSAGADRREGGVIPAPDIPAAVGVIVLYAVTLFLPGALLGALAGLGAGRWQASRRC